MDLDFSNDALGDRSVNCWGRVDGLEAYALSLQVRPPQAVVVFIEVHHLHAVELARDFPDLLLLLWGDDFDALGIPAKNEVSALRREAGRCAYHLMYPGMVMRVLLYL